ncbi:hypothetical protein GYMLUDRAFT_250398 [Collybiopsis luxurians FD-317 M1]|uniref:DUF6534 domain-containing protein n=1 Tax=Collybiopsis luxurians FD-317 M1 TaxID=944289 RepID=A0A0D0ASP8_9AGAR|nr:hypothetical protein GYMLUDRAFT_250398 [Collybiopsis luxurians FD-317 M1]
MSLASDVDAIQSVVVNSFGAVLVGAVVTAIFAKGTFTAFEESRMVKYAAAIPYAVFGILSDAMIAISLCLLLRENCTGIKQTKSLVVKLVVYAVNRFLLLSVLAIAQIVAFLVNPANLSFLAIDFVSGTLYANSLLASLNFRQSLRQQLGSIVGDSADLKPSVVLQAQTEREWGQNHWGTTAGKSAQGPSFALDTLRTKSNTVDDDLRLYPAPKITTEVFQSSD